MSREYILTTNTLLDNILAVDKVRQHEELPDTLNKVEERMKELGEDERKEFLVWLKEILIKTFPEEQDIATLIQTLKERRSDAMVYSIERIYKKRLKEDGKEELFIQALKDKEMKEDLYQQFDIK